MIGGQPSSIDLEKLQPEEARRLNLEWQRRDWARTTDPATGLLRADVAVPTACYVCSADDAELRFVKGGYRFVQCRRCTLVYVNPRLADTEVAKLYQDGGRGKFLFEQLFLPSAPYRKARLYPERLDFIEARVPRGRLLDVGCSTGHFLEAAQERGWEVYGVELAAYAVRHAWERLGLDHVHHGELKNAPFPEDFFEAITLWDVIEHLTDPHGMLNHVRRLLRPGGMVFIYTPHWDCFEREVLGPECVNFMGDMHLMYFTRDALRRVVADAGLDVEVFESFGLDLDHIISFHELNSSGGDLTFLKAHKDTLQACIDAAGRGCYLRAFARRRR